MKLLKRIGLVISIISIVYIVLNVNEVYASDVDISASKTTATVGESITVTATVTSGAWNLNLSVAGQSKGLVGQTDIADNSTATTSITFTANEAKTYVATVTGDETDFHTGIVNDKVNKTVSIVVNPAENPTPTPTPSQEPTPVPTPTPTPTPTATPTPVPTPETPTKSSNASLKGWQIGDSFIQNKSDITLDNSQEKVTVTAVPSDSKAKVIKGNGTYDLVEGGDPNFITVTIEAEDGTTKEHKIIIRRAAAPDPISPPNVVEEEKDEEKEEETEEDKEDEKEELGLLNLVITGIKLNPTFKADVYEYKAEFSEDLDVLEILATANDESASVEVVGNKNLKIGENLISIIVKSENEETTKTYEITVLKNEPIVTTNEMLNTVVAGTTQNEALKGKIGKIVLFAVIAIIVVIVLGIIVIINTKKKEEEEYFNSQQKRNKKSARVSKEDFTVAIDEDESYKELEKLSSIHKNNNIFDDKKTDTYMEDTEIASSKFNEEYSKEILAGANNLGVTKNYAEELESRATSKDDDYTPHKKNNDDIFKGFEKKLDKSEVKSNNKRSSSVATNTSRISNVRSSVNSNVSGEARGKRFK